MFSPKCRSHKRERRFISSPSFTDTGSAFTLVELLVVIGIISVVAGLLLPALTRSRQQAQGIQCLSNLRQLSIAWHLYSVDSRDWLSPSETRLKNLDSLDGLME